MGMFELQETPLAGVRLVQRKRLEDKRGFLSRLFCAEALGLAGPVQINLTLTQQKGTVRGMHFQYPPCAETKVVNCMKGRVFDVAVDLRRSSPTFLCWYGEELSAENQRSLIIPPGVAHGFQALEEGCELLYFHSTSYRPEAEGGLNPRDPGLAIEWPLEISDMSDRDLAHPFIKSDFAGIEI